MGEVAEEEELAFHLGTYSRNRSGWIHFEQQEKGGPLSLTTDEEGPIPVKMFGRHRLCWVWRWGYADFLVMSSKELLEIKPEGNTFYWQHESDADRGLLHVRRWLEVSSGWARRMDVPSDYIFSPHQLKRIDFSGYLGIECFFPCASLAMIRAAIIGEPASIPSASARALSSTPLLKMLADPLRVLAAQAAGCSAEELEDPKACVLYNNRNLECKPFEEYAATRGLGLPNRRIAGVYDGRDPLISPGELVPPVIWIGLLLNDQQVLETGNFVMYPGSHRSMADVVAAEGTDLFRYSELAPLTSEVREAAFPVRDCEPPEAVRMREGSVLVAHGAVMFGFLANTAGDESVRSLYIPFYKKTKRKPETPGEGKWEIKNTGSHNPAALLGVGSGVVVEGAGGGEQPLSASPKFSNADEWTEVSGRR